MPAGRRDGWLVKACRSGLLVSEAMLVRDRGELPNNEPGLLSKLIGAR